MRGISIALQITAEQQDRNINMEDAMENRERDEISRNESSNSSSEEGKVKSDSNASFGKKIEDSEKWESEPGNSGDLSESDRGQGMSGGESEH